MLLLYDARRGGEYSERRLSQTCIVRLTACQQGLKQFWPRLACNHSAHGQVISLFILLPSSVYCRAISATASAVLLRTVPLLSELRAWRSLLRIASRWGAIKVRNNSLVTGDCSLEAGSFRVRFEMRRNSTAAKERVYSNVSLMHLYCSSNNTPSTYRGVI